ncbi:MAG: sigma-70 family RNA polymerase sigma factor, partial [Chloroflexota bacterium]
TLERIVAAGTVVGGATPGRGPADVVEAAEVQATLRDALASMPEAERTVIVMAYQQELSQSEIAERLGWPLGTVKTRTRRGLSRLRTVLADELGPMAGLAAVPVPTGEES